MSDGPKTYDHWLADDGAVPPAALVIREHLMPVEGKDGVVFPPTFAPEQGNAEDRFRGGYNIDVHRIEGNENVCLIDTVGSQANRIEPLFATGQYRGLVPTIEVRAGDEVVSILDAGHRAGDALIRCSELQEDFRRAFSSLLKGDAERLAKTAPTSLVFGVWDSRDTQAKLPRVIASAIRAFNVRPITRHAQFVPAAPYNDEQWLGEPADAAEADQRASRGYAHQPIGKQPDGKTDPTHGGVIATGGIRRDATLSLAAIRLLAAGKDESRTLTLRRYILGLALTAFTHPSAFVGYLRQGCSLVLDPDKPREFVEVHPDGRRVPSTITHKAALEYAEAAAAAFGVGQSRTVDFDRERAKKDIQGDGSGSKKGKSKKQAN